MELLSARLGDCLAHLYMASACIWRYSVEGDAQMLPIARSALRTQLDAAEEVLQDLYANLPAPGRRFIGSLVLSRTAHLAPLRDVQMLALAKLLRENPSVVKRLCPDVSLPKSGGFVDLVKALELAQQLGDDATSQLNKLVRRTHSFEEAAAGMPNPALALAYLQAADKVIQVDDFAP
jgi:acyl-CoA dehydrogenase